MRSAGEAISWHQTDISDNFKELIHDISMTSAWCHVKWSKSDYRIALCWHHADVRYLLGLHTSYWVNLEWFISHYKLYKVCKQTRCSIAPYVFQSLLLMFWAILFCIRCAALQCFDMPTFFSLWQGWLLNRSCLSVCLHFLKSFLIFQKKRFCDYDVV